MTLNLFSPAKINLFLRVTNRRDDGYHELSTLMQAVDLGDFISLAFSTSDFFSCSDPSIECDRGNLCMKALALFREKTGLRDPVSIKLTKNIPSQAGLGGGSGNAATTLWGLNKLFHSPVSEETLRIWSVQLGADVPFFFSLGTAHCTGIGERMHPETPLAQTYYLHKPAASLSTAAVFNKFCLEKATQEDRLYQNDLEIPAFAACPSLFELKKRLERCYERVFMTGTGSSLIGVGGEHKEGVAMQPINRKPGSWYPYYTRIIYPKII